MRATKRTSTATTSKRRNTTTSKAASVSKRELGITQLRIDSRPGERDLFAVNPQEKASAVLVRLGDALSKPSMDWKRIFKNTTGKGIYIYSVDPKDVTRFVREDSVGNKTVGRFISGRFRALSTERQT